MQRKKSPPLRKQNFLAMSLYFMPWMSVYTAADRSPPVRRCPTAAVPRIVRRPRCRKRTFRTRSADTIRETRRDWKRTEDSSCRIRRLPQWLRSHDPKCLQTDYSNKDQRPRVFAAPSGGSVQASSSARKLWVGSSHSSDSIKMYSPRPKPNFEVCTCKQLCNDKHWSK